jgi:ribosomal protein S18 acetylase RimI-like enzyme
LRRGNLSAASPKSLEALPMSAPAIEIRSARPDELAIVQELAHVVWHAHYPGIITVEQIDYMLARGYATDVLAGFLHGSDRGLQLAVVGGEAAGFAAWNMIDRTEAKLDKLYVLPTRQRFGLGGQLIRQVMNDAGAAGAATLILNVNKRNAQAIRAYERHGFAIREAVKNDIGNGFVMDDYVMARSILIAAPRPERTP